MSEATVSWPTRHCPPTPDSRFTESIAVPPSITTLEIILSKTNPSSALPLTSQCGGNGGIMERNFPKLDVVVRVTDPRKFVASGLAGRPFAHGPSAFEIELDGDRFQSIRGSESKKKVPLTNPFQISLDFEESLWATPSGQKVSSRELWKYMELNPGKRRVRILFTGLGKEAVRG